MTKLFKSLLLLAFLFGVQTFSSAGVIDKVVAFIDDEAITLSELDSTYAEVVKIKPDITRQEVLNTMINRFLLLREAKRLRLEAPDDDTLLNEYIDLKVKAFIKISEKDIKEFYDNNRDEFGSVQFNQVKDKIETYLREKEVNNRLRQHIEELKKKAYIKILLE